MFKSLFKNSNIDKHIDKLLFFKLYSFNKKKNTKDFKN